MGLFDKEKLKDLAIKAKDGVINAYDEAKQEQERRKELGLLDDVQLGKLEYKGGHPALPKEKDCNLKITNENLTISYGFTNEATINFENILGLHFETADQISHRITATRILTLGVFALAFKKKKKSTEKYFTIDFRDNDIENTVVIGGKNAQIAHSKTYERYTNYLKRNKTLETENKTEVEQVSIDPYEEIKKAKELLDMGIISQEEFEQKKKELLGL